MAHDWLCNAQTDFSWPAQSIIYNSWPIEGWPTNPPTTKSTKFSAFPISANAKNNDYSWCPCKVAPSEESALADLSIYWLQLLICALCRCTTLCRCTLVQDGKSVHHPGVQEYMSAGLQEYMCTNPCIISLATWGGAGVQVLLFRLLLICTNPCICLSCASELQEWNC